ncbi:hypothetical protein [Niveibacterium sp. SC-1]|uniref:hypothetical protein n=1 Tax=Niveibacterium sp. SC-1 TaxID=3135646 RepID=UPI0031203E48
MKTLTVTHGEWVRYRTSLALADTVYQHLQDALEGDDAQARRAAQKEVLRLVEEAQRVRGGWLLDSTDQTLEVLEFETELPRALFPRERPDTAEWAPAA